MIEKAFRARFPGALLRGLFDPRKTHSGCLSTVLWPTTNYNRMHPRNSAFHDYPNHPMKPDTCPQMNNTEPRKRVCLGCVIFSLIVWQFHAA